MRHTLLRLGYPLRAVHKYADAVRLDNYDVSVSSSEEHRALSGLLHAARSLEISWVRLGTAPRGRHPRVPRLAPAPAPRSSPCSGKAT